MSWKEMPLLEKLKAIALMLVVFGALFFIFDHFLVWKFHLQVLAEPCTVAENVCKKVMPTLSQCFQQARINYSDVIINGKHVNLDLGPKKINLSEIYPQ